MKENRNTRDSWTLSTWNIRSMQAKEIEIMNQFEKKIYSKYIISNQRNEEKGKRRFVTKKMVTC